LKQNANQSINQSRQLIWTYCMWILCAGVRWLEMHRTHRR